MNGNSETPEPTPSTSLTQDNLKTLGESPPLTPGPKRLHYQFSSVLPQIHLTFVSIVQGIAFGILIQDWPIPQHLDVGQIGAFILAQHLYLPWIISGLVVVIIWKQFVQASLLLVWPLSVRQVSLMLLIAVAETIAFREIQYPFAWIVGLGIVAIIGGCIRLNNLGLRRESDYESVELKKKDDLAEILSGVGYIALGVVVLIPSGIALNYVPVLEQNAPLLTWVALGLLMCVVILVIIFDALDLKLAIDDYVKKSDLEYVPRGFIRYRTAMKPTQDAVAVSNRPKSQDV